MKPIASPSSSSNCCCSCCSFSFSCRSLPRPNSPSNPSSYSTSIFTTLLLPSSNFELSFFLSSSFSSFSTSFSSSFSTSFSTSSSSFSPSKAMPRPHCTAETGSDKQSANIVKARVTTTGSIQSGSRSTSLDVNICTAALRISSSSTSSATSSAIWIIMHLRSKRSKAMSYRMAKAAWDHLGLTRKRRRKNVWIAFRGRMGVCRTR
mmetsp:Transcript_1089/g.1594  ORF Transcript_1089/g.1594 Transcript_1089/m.1594 type:complete len:206 (-) Transcript_1089:367-984(-)